MVNPGRPPITALVFDMATPAFAYRGVERGGLLSEYRRVGDVAANAGTACIPLLGVWQLSHCVPRNACAAESGPGLATLGQAGNADVPER